MLSSSSTHPSTHTHLHHRGRALPLDHLPQFNLGKFCGSTTKVTPKNEEEVAKGNPEASSADEVPAGVHTSGNHWHTQKENYEEFWETYDGQKDPLILKSLGIAPDGGLDPEEIARLWGNDVSTRLMKCWGALQNAVCTVGNISYLIYFNINVLQRGTSSDAFERKSRWLIGTGIYNLLHGKHDFSGEEVVVCVELGLIAVMLLGCTFYILRALCSRRACDRWWHIYMLFWQVFPTMATFTAMKLLFYVDPGILMTEMLLEFSMFKARCVHGRWLLAFWKLCKFFFIRAICFVVGLDAFLVKFRETSANYINFSQEEVTLSAFLGSAAFLFQVLSVVNVTAIVKTRLFFFIFGGEDCAVSTRDKAKEWVWNAMLTQKIWETHRPFKFFIVMLSFTDCDIQHLLLHVKSGSKVEVRAASPREVS